MAMALASAFLAALDRSAVDAAESTEQLEARLTALIEAARETWPAIPVDPASFVEHVARCVGSDPDPLAALERLSTADLWLAFVGPHWSAGVRFQLARALWSTPSARERARELARATLSDRAAAEGNRGDLQARIKGWLDRPGEAPTRSRRHRRAH